MGADFVVAQGSMVGIVAVYWNKPFILLGQSFYDELGVVLAKSYTYQKPMLCPGGEQH